MGCSQIAQTRFHGSQVPGPGSCVPLARREAAPIEGCEQAPGNIQPEANQYETKDIGQNRHAPGPVPATGNELSSPAVREGGEWPMPWMRGHCAGSFLCDESSL